LFLVPIVKNIQFLLVSRATDWYYEDRSKDVGAVKIYYTNEKTLLPSYLAVRRKCTYFPVQPKIINKNLAL
jgi:hypothetical protein